VAPNSDNSRDAIKGTFVKTNLRTGVGLRSSLVEQSRQIPAVTAKPSASPHYNRFDTFEGAGREWFARKLEQLHVGRPDGFWAQDIAAIRSGKATPRFDARRVLGLSLDAPAPVKSDSEGVLLGGFSLKGASYGADAERARTRWRESFPTNVPKSIIDNLETHYFIKEENGGPIFLVPEQTLFENLLKLARMTGAPLASLLDLSRDLNNDAVQSLLSAEERSFLDTSRMNQ
jgi:hypothetical protein